MIMKIKNLSIIKTILYYVLLAFLIILLINKYSAKRVRYDSSSNLVKAMEIEQLNLAKYTWNGIAAYYKDNKNKVDTYIKYEAEIVATMDLKNFEKNIEIDNEKKMVIVTLPKIELKPNILFKDGGNSFSFIPKNTDIEMSELIRVCEDDAINEISKKTKINKIAKANAKSTIKGLLLPLLEDNDYKIEWKDGE